MIADILDGVNDDHGDHGDDHGDVLLWTMGTSYCDVTLLIPISYNPYNSRFLYWNHSSCNSNNYKLL